MNEIELWALGIVGALIVMAIICAIFGIEIGLDIIGCIIEGVFDAID